MIPQISLAGLAKPVSRVGFGTSRIHRSGSEAEGRDILRRALDAGFTYFDTAPLYGYGLAETMLRAVAADPRISIATKVGLYPPGGAGQGRAAMLARKIAGKAFSSLSRAVASDSVTRARASLDASLKRLGRDRIEVLLIHEPQPAMFDTDEWIGFFERQADRVETFGIAGEAHDLSAFVARAGRRYPVIQTRDADAEGDILRTDGLEPSITFGFSAAAAKSAGLRSLLAAGLERNRSGIILASSRDPHMLANVTLDAMNGVDAERPGDRR